MTASKSLVAVLLGWLSSYAFAQVPTETELRPQAAHTAHGLSPRAVENLTAAAKLLSYVRFFHPSDQAVGVTEWDRFAVYLMEEAESPADAKELASRLTEVFAPIAPTLQVWPGSQSDAPPLPALPAAATYVRSWKHNGVGTLGSELPHNVYHSKVERAEADPGATDRARNYVIKDLGGGVACRLPVGVYADANGALPHGKTPGRWAKQSGLPELTARDRSVRLAGVALAWGVFQHFYPYFDVVPTDWDAALPAALRKAAEDADEIAYLLTLREMLAKLHDGHANVSNPALRVSSLLPLAVEWAGTELVVVGASAAAEAVQVGDVVVAIDGRSADECYREVSKWISAATDGWRRVQAIQRLTINLPTSDPAPFTLRRPDGSEYSVTLARVQEWPANTATTNRPEDGTELAPGIVYFDLDQASVADLNQAMGKLEPARGIVFDLRGYPGDAGIELMEHLIDAPATSQRWIVPLFRRPDRDNVQWSQLERWNLVPKTLRLTGQVAFLTDGRAISYAESIMGIVEHYKFGEIVGSTTAGTNGNVNPFTLPGGYRVSWTGMVVLKHDGSRHHGVGIAPTVPIVPTPAGIAAGKDEVLEKAVDVLKTKLASSKPTDSE